SRADHGRGGLVLALVESHQFRGGALMRPWRPQPMIVDMLCICGARYERTEKVLTACNHDSRVWRGLRGRTGRMAKLAHPDLPAQDAPARRKPKPPLAGTTPAGT